jgi:integrase
MANQDRTIAKVGKVQVYRRGGDTCFLKWYDPTVGRGGNYRRRSARTRDLRHALAMAADLSDALDSGEAEPDKVALGPTVAEAAAAHPSTRREREASPPDHRRHAAALEDYIGFSGSPSLRDLTVERTLAWAGELEARGLAFDTRRHMLLPLRRASAMAPSFGLHDVLSDLRIDRRGEPLEVKTADLDGLRNLVERAKEERDPRWPTAIALMALMGLRPSEVVRLRVGDLKDGLLTVGARGAKNAASRRVLPVPNVALGMLAPMLEGKAADDPLIPLSANEGSALSILSRGVGGAMGRAGLDLPCKCLRKSFASACVNDLDVRPGLVEAFLGHAASGTGDVTRRHYLARVGAERLRPVADAVDRAFA